MKKISTPIPWHEQKWHEQKIEPITLEGADKIVREMNKRHGWDNSNPFQRNERLVWGESKDFYRGVENRKTARKRLTLPYFIFNDTNSYVFGNREYFLILRVDKIVPWAELLKIWEPSELNSKFIFFYSDVNAPCYERMSRSGRDRYLKILIFLNRNFNTQFWM